VTVLLGVGEGLAAVESLDEGWHGQFTDVCGWTGRIVITTASIVVIVGVVEVIVVDVVIVDVVIVVDVVVAVVIATSRRRRRNVDHRQRAPIIIIRILAKIVLRIDRKVVFVDGAVG